ncbi:unnamed protein product [Adineta steineri]|uniref:Uncharacterized protein n=1 Tax=Adineta steineri TaxID=433720 RepID=A0A819A966_9BILA|nr:unnamed protein product [Adineta steineri]
MVWRGYNGHVYFSPIKVQPLESDRIFSSTKSHKSTSIRTAPLSTKRPQRSQTVSTEHQSRKSLATKSVTSKTRTTNTNRSLSTHRGYAQTIPSDNELISATRSTFTEEEKNKEEPTKMWRSVVTCIPTPKKPISKRSQHALEDMRLIKQKQLVDDPIGSNRPVLPNIRLIPKTKFLYKGLAYKEVKKISGISNEYDDYSTNSLRRPLVDYNRTQAYIRHEVNTARTKRMYQPPPTAQSINGEQSSRSPTVTDIREVRKRIVRGTTVAHHPASRRPGRTDTSSVLESEVLVPVRGFSTLSHLPAATSLVTTSIPQHNVTGYTSPMVSQNFDIPSIETHINIIPLPSTTEQRPSTAKSKLSSSAQQTNGSEKPLLTKYVNRPRSTSRTTPTTDIILDTSSMINI